MSWGTHIRIRRLELKRPTDEFEREVQDIGGVIEVSVQHQIGHSKGKPILFDGTVQHTVGELPKDLRDELLVVFNKVVAHIESNVVLLNNYQTPMKEGDY